jgi:hypothetical protein
VIAQIPYRNIAGMSGFKYSWRKFLGSTWWTGTTLQPFGPGIRVAR